MRVATAVVLSSEEKKWLEKNIRSKTTEVRLVERSKIVLLAADKFTNQEIAAKLGIATKTVRRWRDRFSEDRMKAIVKDKPRGKNHGGKNTASQARLRRKIIKITIQEKPSNATHWSSRTLAKKL